MEVVIEHKQALLLEQILQLQDTAVGNGTEIDLDRERNLISIYKVVDCESPVSLRGGESIKSLMEKEITTLADGLGIHSYDVNYGSHSTRGDYHKMRITFNFDNQQNLMPQMVKGIERLGKLQSLELAITAKLGFRPE